MRRYSKEIKPLSVALLSEEIEQELSKEIIQQDIASTAAILIYFLIITNDSVFSIIGLPITTLLQAPPIRYVTELVPHNIIFNLAQHYVDRIKTRLPGFLTTKCQQTLVAWLMQTTHENADALIMTVIKKYHLIGIAAKNLGNDQIKCASLIKYTKRYDADLFSMNEYSIDEKSAIADIKNYYDVKNWIADLLIKWLIFPLITYGLEKYPFNYQAYKKLQLFSFALRICFYIAFIINFTSIFLSHLKTASGRNYSLTASASNAFENILFSVIFLSNTGLTGFFAAATYAKSDIAFILNASCKSLMCFAEMIHKRRDDLSAANNASHQPSLIHKRGKKLPRFIQSPSKVLPPSPLKTVHDEHSARQERSAQIQRNQRQNQIINERNQNTAQQLPTSIIFSDEYQYPPPTESSTKIFPLDMGPMTRNPIAQIQVNNKPTYIHHTQFGVYACNAPLDKATEKRHKDSIENGSAKPCKNETRGAALFKTHPIGPGVGNGRVYATKRIPAINAPNATLHVFDEYVANAHPGK
jgi:hypothetical protein